MAAHTCSTELGASLQSGGVCPAHEPLQKKADTISTLLLSCNADEPRELLDVAVNTVFVTFLTVNS